MIFLNFRTESTSERFCPAFDREKKRYPWMNVNLKIQYFFECLFRMIFLQIFSL